MTRLSVIERSRIAGLGFLLLLERDRSPVCPGRMIHRRDAEDAEKTQQRYLRRV